MNSTRPHHFMQFCCLIRLMFDHLDSGRSLAPSPDRTEKPFRNVAHLFSYSRTFSLVDSSFLQQPAFLERSIDRQRKQFGRLRMTCHASSLRRM